MWCVSNVWNIRSTKLLSLVLELMKIVAARDFTIDIYSLSACHMQLHLMGPSLPVPSLGDIPMPEAQS